MKDLTYVLDIGSSKLSLIACYVDKGKSSIVTDVELAYDGFIDGEFFSEQQVKEVIAELIDQMNLRLNKKVKNLYIGVPGEFSACVCKRVTRTFVPSRKIAEGELEQLFDGVSDFSENEQYVVASFSPLKFDLDGIPSVKLTSQRISQFVMDCSYVLVKKTFVELMQGICQELGISNIDFVSTALAQSQYVTKQLNKDPLKPTILIDIGHITTSVIASIGEGLLMLSSFSLGGGHITADLMQVNDLSYNDADIIKRKVCLTIQSKKDEKYIVYNNSKPIKALINITNDVVKARIENIANVVARVLGSSNMFNDLPIYLTGDGVCNFRGVINVFEAITGRKVSIVKSSLNNGSDKYQTSKISLANIIGELI